MSFEQITEMGQEQIALEQMTLGQMALKGAS
jgi:hypothetical protein